MTLEEEDDSNVMKVVWRRRRCGGPVVSVPASGLPVPGFESRPGASGVADHAVIFYK